MTHWQRTLKLQPEWDAAERKDLPIHKLAGVIAERLKALRSFPADTFAEDERSEIADEFATLSADDTTTADDFDVLMERLYDWGDSRLDNDCGDLWSAKKLCWIDRFSRRDSAAA